MSLDKPIQIFDARGNPYPFTSYGNGAQIYTTPQDSNQRTDIPWLDADISRLFSRIKHRRLLSAVRLIVTQFPSVDAAAEQKSDYVSSGGWLPIFAGRDEAWGRDATAALHSALRILDVRGPLFSFAKDMKLASRLLDIDGEIFVVHLRSETGFPQIQVLEAHRIGCRSGETLVATGPYKGLPILNGIIYNPAGRPVAYRFLADDPAQDRDLSAMDVTRIAHARWFSDGRPVGAIASGLLDWCDIKETRDFEKIAAKVNAALAIIETNETGTARPGLLTSRPPTQTPSADGSTTAASAPPPEFLGGGLIRYQKAGPGHDIKAHQSNRPSDSWQRFDERVEAGALRGMGWRQEMNDLSKLSGAGVRGFQDNINTSIHARWDVLAGSEHPSPAVAIVVRTIAALIDRGDISRHAEWDKWIIPPPIDFTVDANKDRQTDVLMVEAGFSCSDDVVRKLGYASSEILIRRQAERIAKQQLIAKEFSNRYGVQIDWRDLGNPKRNPAADQAQAASDHAEASSRLAAAKTAA